MGFIEKLKSLFKHADKMDEKDRQILEGLMQKYNVTADDEGKEDNPPAADAPKDKPKEDPQGNPAANPKEQPKQNPDESTDPAAGHFDNPPPAADGQTDPTKKPDEPPANTPPATDPASQNPNPSPAADSKAQETPAAQPDLSAILSQLEESKKANEALGARMSALEDVVSKLSIRSEEPTPDEDFGLSGKGKTGSGGQETPNVRNQLIKELGGTVS
jgi:hypothetical protein